MDLIPTPQEITTLEKVGEYAIKSGFLPGTIKTPQQAVIIALKGKELGIPPLQAFAQISVVNGKPTIFVDINNLQILCADCNLGKSNIYDDDWRKQNVNK